MNMSVLTRIISEAIAATLEDRQPGNPNVAYHEQLAKGEVSKVIATLKGQTMNGANRVLRDFVELKYALNELTEQQKRNEEAVREYFPGFFDAADRAYTNTIELGNITLTLAKANAQGRATVDYNKVIAGLLQLVPDLTDKVDELIKQNTKISAPAKSALSAQYTDEPGEVGRIRNNLKQAGYYENVAISEDFLNSIKVRFFGWLKGVMGWFNQFDRKVALLKHLVSEQRALPFKDMLSEGFNAVRGTKFDAVFPQFEGNWRGGAKYVGDAKISGVITHDTAYTSDGKHRIWFKVTKSDSQNYVVGQEYWKQGKNFYPAVKDYDYPANYAQVAQDKEDYKKGHLELR